MCASRRPDDINGFLIERGRSWRGLSRSVDCVQVVIALIMTPEVFPMA